MIRASWMLILGLAIFSLVLSGCSPALPITPTSTPQIQKPIELKNTPTLVTEEIIVASPAPSSYASLDGLVWDDQDRDGMQDFQEKGVPNVAVSLLSSARTVAGTTTTNENGAYQFRDLVPGDYFVSLTPPPGFIFSPQDLGVNELVDSDTDPGTAETIPVTLVAGENGLVFTTGIYSPTATVQSESGTVKPPPADIYVCVPGNYSLGGISTVIVNAFAPGYCLHAYLWNHGFAIGRIPSGAGRILSDVTFVEFFNQGTFVYQYDVPGETNSIQVCYAVPAGKQAQIYFFNHFGPRFGHPHAGQPAWVPLETITQNGTACAASQTSGAYALVGN